MLQILLKYESLATAVSDPEFAPTFSLSPALSRGQDRRDQPFLQRDRMLYITYYENKFSWMPVKMFATSPKMYHLLPLKFQFQKAAKHLVLRTATSSGFLSYVATTQGGCRGGGFGVSTWAHLGRVGSKEQVKDGKKKKEYSWQEKKGLTLQSGARRVLARKGD